MMIGNRQNGMKSDMAHSSHDSNKSFCMFFSSVSQNKYTIIFGVTVTNIRKLLEVKKTIPLYFL